MAAAAMTMIGHVTLKALAVLVTLVGFTLCVAWYGFLEPSFLSYPHGAFEPIADAFVAGEPVLLRPRRCSSSSETESYVITRRLIRLDPPPGEKVEPIILPGSVVDIEPGCHDDEISGANVPPRSTPPGVYFVKGLSKTDGRWRASKVPWSSRPFRVVSPQPAASAPG